VSDTYDYFVTDLSSGTLQKLGATLTGTVTGPLLSVLDGIDHAVAPLADNLDDVVTAVEVSGDLQAAQGDQQIAQGDQQIALLQQILTILQKLTFTDSGQLNTAAAVNGTIDVVVKNDEPIDVRVNTSDGPVDVNVVNDEPVNVTVHDNVNVTVIAVDDDVEVHVTNSALDNMNFVDAPAFATDPKALLVSTGTRDTPVSFSNPVHLASGGTVGLTPGTSVGISSGSSVGLVPGTTVGASITGSVAIPISGVNTPISLAPGTSVGLANGTTVGLTGGTSVGLVSGTTVGLATGTTVAINNPIILATGQTVNVSVVDDFVPPFIYNNRNNASTSSSVLGDRWSNFTGTIRGTNFFAATTIAAPNTTTAITSPMGVGLSFLYPSALVGGGRPRIAVGNQLL